MPRTLLARNDVPVHETWALEHLFATSADFDAAQRSLSADVAAFAAHRGALAPDAATLAAWLADPGLARHRPFLERLAHRRPHVRSAEVEDVLAAADATFDAYEEARDTLVEGDVDFGAVTAPDGLRSPGARLR